MGTEEYVRYGLYTACPTQQQTVSKAVLEATSRAASISSVRPGPYHRGQAHQHLILRSLGSLLLKYLSWFKPYPSPSIFLLLLLLPRSSGCRPLCSSVCRRWTDTNTRPCSCSIGFYPLGAQVGAGTIPSVLVHHLCFSEPFQCLVTSFLSPVVCTFLKI